MDSDKKKWVRDSYGKIAEGKQSGCCPSSSECGCGDYIAIPAERIGYTQDEIKEIPDGAEMGLGCGNPIGLADICQGDTVLDLGCGGGVDVFLAAKRVGNPGHVIGVDMTPEMIETARRNAENGGYENVEFRLGDIESLPVDDKSIDLVISNCVLNLVPDKEKAFSEIFRVLKSGGRVSISDIVLIGELPDDIKDIPEYYCACVSGAINRDEYLLGLKKAGLSQIEVVHEIDAGEMLVARGGIVSSITVKARKL